MLASNRDFVMSRSVKVNDDGSISANHVSVEHPEMGDQKGYVRGEIDVSGYYITPTGDNSCKCYYVVQLDPKGVSSSNSLKIFILICPSSGYPLL